MLRAKNTDAGFAEYGSVFSSTRYQRDDEDSYQPQPLELEVLHGTASVAGCEVLWQTRVGNGWVFAAHPESDNSGKVRAFWTAGDRSEQTAIASIIRADSSIHSVTFTGRAWPSQRTRTDSVHISYAVPSQYFEFRVRVTPVTAPASTYYSTLNFTGAYAGIQFDESNGVRSSKVLFSVWDRASDHKASIVDPGACNQTVDFGGEGTGTSCRLALPPNVHGHVPDLPDDYQLRPGDSYETHLVVSYPNGCQQCTDYTLYFTDVTRALGPISLGTQRYAAKVELRSASGFIEDWWDQNGDHCLNTGARTAYFHDIAAKTTKGWQAIFRASFDPVVRPDNHEICSNYFFGAEGKRFLVSSGGAEYVSRPIIEGDAEFGKALSVAF